MGKRKNLLNDWVLLDKSLKKYYSVIVWVKKHSFQRNKNVSLSFENRKL